MSRPPQRALARRALVEDPPKLSWLHRGVAILAVSALGLGVAGSIALTGSAQQTLTPNAVATPSSSPSVETSRDPQVTAPSAFSRRVERTSRGDQREPLTAAGKEASDQPSTSRRAGDEAPAAAVRARADALGRSSTATRKRAAQLARRAAGKAAEKRAVEKTNGTPALPITSGYTIAARFGAVGAWSRYHTGFDLSAPIGTPVHTPQAGVVTTAGSGEASGWAGTYVTVEHPDGTTSLYAHMSQARVSVGQRVRAGQVVGAVGLTGRTFGAHLHFEIYPAGVEPDDVYSAVNPEPWLRELGLSF